MKIEYPAWEFLPNGDFNILERRAVDGVDNGERVGPESMRDTVVIDNALIRWTFSSVSEITLIDNCWKRAYRSIFGKKNREYKYIMHSSGSITVSQFRDRIWNCIDANSHLFLEEEYFAGEAGAPQVSEDHFMRWIRSKIYNCENVCHVIKVIDKIDKAWDFHARENTMPIDILEFSCDTG